MIAGMSRVHLSRPAVDMLVLGVWICCVYHVVSRGVATGGYMGIYIPPKSVQVNFLWGNNDVRTSIEQFYIPPPKKKTFIPLKQISGHTPALCVMRILDC